MKVITLVAIMHENKEISILYTQLAELLPQFCYLLFRSKCLYAMHVYKFDLMLHTLH